MISASYAPDLVTHGAHDVSPAEVSIIVVSFNTREVLRECLQSVVAECRELCAQILVVDNASSDGSAEMVERDFPQVTLVRSSVNLGFGAANNAALRQATGRYFVLLNSDAFFEPGALALAIRHMDECPQVAIGGCRLIGRDGSWQPSSRCFHSVLGDAIVLTGLAARFPRSRLFGRFDRTWADEERPSRVDWVPGAFSILRPAALAKIGLFDPAFFLYYEEVDLCRRVKQAGLQVWYWPDIKVVHIGGESSRQIASLELSRTGAQLTLWRMRSTLLYYRKHHGLHARLAMLVEVVWYWLQSQRRRFSKDPDRRTRARADQLMVSTMRKAWSETKGGRLSPAQPW